MHAKTLATWPEWQTWQQVAGIVNKQMDQAVVRPKNKEVPLLLKDPSALLTQFILLLPMRLEQCKLEPIVAISLCPKSLAIK
jgi:E3 ubiquitin-protein ligase UBR3